MKSVTLPLIAAFCLALGPAPALAQGRRGGGGFGGGRAGGGGLPRGGAAPTDEASTLQLVSALLSLTDTQELMLQGIFDTAALTAAPLALQIDASNKAIFEAAKSGKNDDQIASLAEQQGSRQVQMQQLQAQTFSKLMAILTPSQKPGADAFVYESIGKFLSTPKPVTPAGTVGGVTRATPPTPAASPTLPAPPSPVTPSAK